MIILARAELFSPQAAAQTVDREEAAIVARARVGDEYAVRWLLTRYRPRAIRLAATVTHRTADAEDIAQEAFVHAFRSLGRLRGDGAFGVWLYRIVVRLAVSRLRSASWRTETDRTPADTGSADVSTETSVVVDVLLGQLSPPLRAALVLRAVEGMEYGEIAAVLGIPLGTVRSRLYAARRQFRDLWLANGLEVPE